MKWKFCVQIKTVILGFSVIQQTQQRLSVLFNRTDNPTNCLFQWGISTPSNTRFLEPTTVSPKQHLNRFSRFCAVIHPCGHHRQTYRHTDAHTALRTTSIATGRILCTECMRYGLKSDVTRPNQTQYVHLHMS